LHRFVQQLHTLEAHLFTFAAHEEEEEEEDDDAYDHDMSHDHLSAFLEQMELQQRAII
jgi:hypothetical protein